MITLINPSESHSDRFSMYISQKFSPSAGKVRGHDYTLGMNDSERLSDTFLNFNT